MSRIMGNNSGSHGAEEMEIFRNIRDVSAQIKGVKSLLEFVSNEDLIDAYVFELESLSAKHRYLIKKAKELGIRRNPFDNYGEEIA